MTHSLTLIIPSPTSLLLDLLGKTLIKSIPHLEKGIFVPDGGCSWLQIDLATSGNLNK